MTCIVGLVHEGKVYMGADSCSGDGLDQHIDEMPKLFRLGNMVIGFTSSWRMGQILQYHVDIPEEDVSPDEYVVKHFIPAVRDAFREHGFTEIKDNREEGGYFLIGMRGRLFIVQNDFSVLEPIDHLAAIGCGDRYALGAMWTLIQAPMECIEAGLKAAEHFSSGVMQPFKIEVLESTDLNWKEV
jgi:ATP-dependent protease HslVU (ClpYQ) peptidase subunit